MTAMTCPAEKIDLKNLTLTQLTDWVSALGEPPFRARQVFAWLYRPGVCDFAVMTDVSKKFRALLEEQACISRLRLEKKEVSRDSSAKYAFLLEDGNLIESVLIPDKERNTLCVSSQAGCAMGCSFCLTGAMGLTRNLTPAEMVNQVCYVRDELSARGKDLHNLVFMGMGEPLANFGNLATALDILMEQLGLNFSGRRITVSTCGLADRITELGNRVRVNLAVSLHAADDETRSRLMPVNQAYPLARLMEACRAFPLHKRRRVMIEYILLDGVNDSPEDAKKLIKLLHGLPCKINLLPYNENPGLPFRRPAESAVTVFQDVLRRAGHTAIIRQSRGADISAACGQLAGRSRGREGANETR